MTLAFKQPACTGKSWPIACSTSFLFWSDAANSQTISTDRACTGVWRSHHRTYCVLNRCPHISLFVQIPCCRQTAKSNVMSTQTNPRDKFQNTAQPRSCDLCEKANHTRLRSARKKRLHLAADWKATHFCWRPWELRAGEKRNKRSKAKELTAVTGTGSCRS